MPRAQRLALEPQSAARAARAPGRALPDRQRQRGGGRLSGVAHARRRHAQARAGALSRRSRRLLHVRGRHARRLRGAARSDRLQARGHGRDRRLGRDGDRNFARSPPLPGVDARASGSRRPQPSMPGARARDDGAAQSRRSQRRLAARRNSVLDLSTMPLREVNRLLHETKERRFPDQEPARAARDRLRARWRPRTSWSMATSATIAPG